jgi:hypothetical protein
MTFDILVFFEKIKCHQNLTRITGVLREDCVYLWYGRSFLLRTKSVSGVAKRMGRINKGRNNKIIFPYNTRPTFPKTTNERTTIDNYNWARHGTLRSYCHRFKIMDDPECVCKAGPQTSDHLLWECELLRKQREATEETKRSTQKQNQEGRRQLANNEFPPSKQTY